MMDVLVIVSVMELTAKNVPITLYSWQSLKGFWAMDKTSSYVSQCLVAHSIIIKLINSLAK